LDSTPDRVLSVMTLPHSMGDALVIRSTQPRLE
jgi:hypothetical protein